MLNLSKRSGCTLVELLVVIVIIATLAALSFAVGPGMMENAKATESLQNIRQLGPLLSAYAADHDMRLHASRGSDTRSVGSLETLQWNEICLALLFPDDPPPDFKEKTWWEKKKTIMRNPLFKEIATPRGWSPLNPGYAINEMIPENLAIASGGAVPSHDDLLAISVPLAAIADPGRTPLIAPCDNYFFRYDEAQLKEFQTGTLKDLMNCGKVPVLFVDGHVETLSPTEYLERKLFLVPIILPP